MVESLLEVAMAALRRGDWAVAQQCGAQMLQLAPLDPMSGYVAGVAASRLREFPAAIQHLRRACLLDCDHAEYLVELSRACLAVGQVPEAIAAADRAMELAPSDAISFDTLGVIYGQCGLHERARIAFERAVHGAPGKASSRLNLASSLMFAGDLDAAEVEYDACLEIDPRQWRAHLFRSQIRRRTPARNHVDSLEALLSTQSGQPAQTYLNLALSKELEDLGQLDRSFDHLEAGKTAGGHGRGYSPGHDRVLFDAITASLSSTVDRGNGHDSEEPIFVIGMPRTGTTLVERILSSHPGVRAAGELRNFIVALRDAVGGPPGFILDPTFPERIARIDWRGLGERYLASTRPMTGNTPHFVDKFPHNFLYAGFIARAFPRARIVCLRRGAADTCLSNFRQLFALDSPYFDYSFDLLDTGRYYVLFDRLMSTWADTMPGRILELSYESLVDEQETQTRRLLAFCGLEWDEACLRFEDNATPVATASTVQVREAMNRRSIGRWRRYESRLGGLLELLAENGIAPDA